MMKKLTFDELENTLDREEMRNIMAGSGGTICLNGEICAPGYECCYCPLTGQSLGCGWPGDCVC